MLNLRSLEMVQDGHMQCLRGEVTVFPEAQAVAWLRNAGNQESETLLLLAEYDYGSHDSSPCFTAIFGAGSATLRAGSRNETVTAMREGSCTDIMPAGGSTGEKHRKAYIYLLGAFRRLEATKKLALSS